VIYSHGKDPTRSYFGVFAAEKEIVLEFRSVFNWPDECDDYLIDLAPYRFWGVLAEARDGNIAQSEHSFSIGSPALELHPDGNVRIKGRDFSAHVGALDFDSLFLDSLSIIEIARLSCAMLE